MTRRITLQLVVSSIFVTTASTLLIAGTAFAAPMLASTATPTVKTSTRTPAPAQVTATARAQQALATKQARSAAATSTAEVRTQIIAATATAKSEMATATAEARTAAIQAFVDYLPINTKDLINYADDFQGEKVFVSGRVFNIVPGGDAFQMFFSGTYDGAYIETAEPLADLYEDEVVTVYGVVEGSYCFENTQGNQVCQPRLQNAYFFKKLTPPMQAARSTAQVVSSQATRDARTVLATEQAEQRATVQARISEYKPIAMRDLMTYPEDHVGEKVRVPGRVFNVLGGDGVLQMYAPGTYDGIYVRMEAPFSDLYENDSIVVYGVVGGRECFTNRAGGEVCQPLIEDAFYAK